ncbi:hypothetical protein RMSM_00413 [Rhodopirellula maiorica SM1]|uniref:RiboL-PSP-HEPN domain-containing protein n=1 Tax=Rhodopirellula maiorica SM1 TaxID=1265738 RepID=M5RTJ0_9BACT|nr:HEPN domain-containing protein [Rhodopirellula maiorica]EMI22658.1 hypothetical protein RMSM_00413 [Rhodopirellula maiorica SM1]
MPIISLQKSPLKTFSQRMANIAQLQQAVEDLESLQRMVNKLKTLQLRESENDPLQPAVKDLELKQVRHLPQKQGLLVGCYVVLLVAGWQQFLQGTALNAFQTLDPLLPDLSDKDERKRRKQLRRAGFDIRGGYPFNTPNVKNTDALFRVATGINKISDAWTTEELPSDKVCTRLDHIVQVRHNVAHSIFSLEALSVEENFDDMQFVFTIASITSDRVDEHVKNITDA